MSASLRPTPPDHARQDMATRIRTEANTLAQTRGPAQHRSNCEVAETLMRAGSATGAWMAAYGIFCKGLTHDTLGRVRGDDLLAMDTALKQSASGATQVRFAGTDLGEGATVPVPYAPGATRRFGSPLAGQVFDLQGADTDTFALPPAPALGSDELTAEMAELFAAALLRDTPFEDWEERAQALAEDIAQLPFFAQTQADTATRRRAARGKLSAATLARGCAAGAMDGPYVSQFLLVGSEREDAHTGVVRDGLHQTDQRFAGQAEGSDHLTDWASWLSAQNGQTATPQARHTDTARFVATPRDLASLAETDNPERAVRNAALILLGSDQPTDIGLPEGVDGATRAATLTFGTPHLMTLLSDVALRARKAAQAQKFGVHMRPRPEMTAAGIALAGTGARALGPDHAAFKRMRDQLATTTLLTQIATLNAQRNAAGDDADLGPLDAETNTLLPMAHVNGAPMSPAYAASQATVAGACVTVLKAFFEMFNLPTGLTRERMTLSSILTEHSGFPTVFPPELFGARRAINAPHDTAMLPQIYAPDPATGHTTLREVPDTILSLEGELDKLATNLAQACAFAGNSHYSDLHEAMRLGERVAVALLQEHMLTLREPVSMRFTSFDGDRMMVAGTGGGRAHNDALVLVWDDLGAGGTRPACTQWFTQTKAPVKVTRHTKKTPNAPQDAARWHEEQMFKSLY